MKPRTTLTALALVGLLTAGCGGSSGASSQNKGNSGSVLRVGTTFTCNSINPFASTGTTCAMIFRYNYPFLVQYTGSGAFEGDLATKWTTSGDKLNWTFDLRPGAKWSDGKPLTAADVAFTINTIVKFREGATASEASSVKNVKSATAPTANQVVVTYQKPTANVLGRLLKMPVLPAHVWEKYATGDGMQLKQTPNPAPLVAGGPYRLGKYTKDQIALMEANPNWYGEKPKLSGFGLQFFTSPDAMVNALKNNQIDYAAPLPITAAKPVEQAGFTVSRQPGFRFHDLIINQSPHQKAHPELRNAGVREAFELAVDRKKIIDVAYLGYATPGSSIVPPVTGDWYNPAVKPITFDPAKAAKLLDEAGYRPGPDGIRVAGGKPMSYEVIIPDVEGGEGERALQIVTEDFKKIGVQLKPKPADNATAFDQLTGPGKKYEQFTLSQWGWIAQRDPDFLLNGMTCAQWGSWNDTGYCDEEYDKLYDQQAAAVDDKARQAIVWQMQKMIYDARPYIVTHYDDVVEGHSTRWTGFGQSPLGILDSQSRQGLLSATTTGS
ncbi:ABC transporter substrate-binding protein [Kribbella catacumbae]|uniref:ABC transporter substrate-binding protein n=1 Tax=Kribbella catacumbae TaxID=460086 RepID=UPI00146D0A47|nr:peptide ABC transporter substrate-binding protein [Kribbella catacumbae]